jgi:ribosomal protein S14
MQPRSPTDLRLAPALRAMRTISSYGRRRAKCPACGRPVPVAQQLRLQSGTYHRHCVLYKRRGAA